MTQKIIKTSPGSMPDSFSYNVAFTNIDANFTELYTAAAGAVAVANPSSQLVGLTAINGSAATAMRSDGAPALDQTIAPTWTGIHTFSLAEPRLKFNETDRGTDLKLWDIDVNAGIFTIRTRTDLDGTGIDALKITRGATTAVTSIVAAGDFSTVSGGAVTATAGTVGGIRIACNGTTGTPPQIGIYASTTNTLSFSTATTLRGSFDATGNFKISTIGAGLFVAEGSNAKMGIATLVAGTVVVSTTAVTANSRIFLTAQSLGTVTVGQGLAVSARTAGTSFTITSATPTDTSVVAWMLVEPA